MFLGSDLIPFYEKGPLNISFHDYKRQSISFLVNDFHSTKCIPLWVSPPVSHRIFRY